MKIQFKFIFTATILLLLHSCASKKDILYFQNLNEEESTKFKQDYFQKQIVFEPFDKLSIIVSSLNTYEEIDGKEITRDLTSSYNLDHSLSRQTQAFQPLYEVSKEGNIQIPSLGMYSIAGKSKYQVVDELRELIYKDLIKNKIGNKHLILQTFENTKNISKEDIVVNIQLENFRINVLGEVTKPGTYTITNDKISIVEALALSNDLTISGKRNNIKLIREKNDSIEINVLNLNDSKIFESEYYYLKQNDIVYVEPNHSKVQSSKFNYTSFISLAGILIAVYTVLAK